MKCKNCGAEIPENVSECPYCDASVITVDSIETDVDEGAVMQSPVKQSVQTPVLESNSIIGKKYSFTSTIGTNLTGLFNSRIISTVEVAEDRIFIDIKPKRFHNSPAVMFEDIMGIDTVTKINFYYWFLIIISLLGSFSGQIYLLIFTIIFVVCGRQSKITITQRNGINVVMYCSDVSLGEKFKDEMKQVAKIQ